MQNETQDHKHKRQQRLLHGHSKQHTRLKERKRILGNDFTVAPAAKQLQPGVYDCKGANCCNCKAKKHGNPKVSGGMCTGGGAYRPTAVARSASNRLVRQWLREAQALDADLEGRDW